MYETLLEELKKISTWHYHVDYINACFENPKRETRFKSINIFCEHILTGFI